MYNSIIEKLNDKEIAILGFGLEGVSTYNFIRRHLPDKRLTIIDKCDIRNKVKDENVSIIFGDNYLSNLDKYDLIIKTPGISLKDIDTSNIEDKITSQLELVLEVFKNNTIGITGTKGKSTTTTLIYNVLKDQGYDAYLLGNIGIPILDEVEKYNKNTYLVIEMSAHQLEYTHVSPHIGLILNLFEDHLDHAGTVFHYHMNKMNMFKYQNSDDYGIYCLDNDATVKYINEYKYKSKLYSISNTKKASIYLNNDDVIYSGKVIYNKNNKRKLIGDHNLINIMFVYMVGIILDLDLNKINNTIESFNPLEHRMELVGEYNGITYYNDSIATIPEATINALKALKDTDTLIFGGMDRGIDYRPLIEYLKLSTVRNLICMPTTGYKVGKILEKDGIDKNYYYIESLEEAVKTASKITQKGKIVLMSPAASSYEYFKNFIEKGNKYKEYIRNL